MPTKLCASYNRACAYVDDRTGERKRFRSVILPPYMRRSPKVTEVLPHLYLHGLSTGDFAPALEEFFGAVTGLSCLSFSTP